MDHQSFKDNLIRLARYFRKGGLSDTQMDAWWEQLKRVDLQDWIMAVDDLIADGKIGQMPTIRQAMAACIAHRSARRRQREELQRASTLEDIKANGEFQRAARRNMLRLFSHIFVDGEGVVHKPGLRGQIPEGCIRKRRLTHEEALKNLYALADKHGSDPSAWPFLPTGDRVILQAYGRIMAWLRLPSRMPRPGKSDLDLMNRQWVERFFQPEAERIDHGGGFYG